MISTKQNLAMIRRMREVVGEAQDMEPLSAAHMFTLAAIQCQYNHGETIMPLDGPVLQRAAWLMGAAMVARATEDMSYILHKLQAWEASGHTLDELIKKEG